MVVDEALEILKITSPELEILDGLESTRSLRMSTVRLGTRREASVVMHRSGLWRCGGNCATLSAGLGPRSRNGHHLVSFQCPSYLSPFNIHGMPHDIVEQNGKIRSSHCHYRKQNAVGFNSQSRASSSRDIALTQDLALSFSPLIPRSILSYLAQC